MSSSRAATDTERFDTVIVDIPNPSTGSEWSYTIPANNVMELVSAIGAFTTDFAGVSRYPNLQFFDAAPSLFAEIPGDLAIRTDTYLVICWLRGIGYRSTLTAPAVIMFGLPHDMRLQPGMIISSHTVSIRPNDRWQNIRLSLHRWIIA